MEHKSILPSVTETELESISHFQYGMHFSTPMIQYRLNPTATIDSEDRYPEYDRPESNFRFIPKKSSWTATGRERLIANQRGSGLVEYHFNSKMDHAINCYVIRDLPSVGVSKKYENKIQIKWAPNLGHHSYISILLYFGSEGPLTLTPTWLDIQQQHLQLSSRKLIYRHMIGDSAVVGDWDNVVPKITIKTPLSYTFEKHISYAIPLFTLPEGSNAHVDIKYKLDLSTLIRMRAERNGEWIDIPFNWKFIEGYNPGPNQDSAPNITMLPPPEVWATYGKMTDEERSWFQQEVFTKGSESAPMTYYYEDVVELPINDLKVPLSSKLPAKGIYWVAQHKKSLEYNNYNNYTTNPHEIRSGSSPIESISMLYGGTDKKIEDMKSYHFDEITAYYSKTTIDVDCGYGCLPLCYDMMDIRATPIGLTFSNLNVELKFRLRSEKSGVVSKEIDDDVDEAISKAINSNDSDDKLKSNYDIHVFLLVTKRVDFYYKAKPIIYDGSKVIKY